jgi:hypothetical protein
VRPTGATFHFASADRRLSVAAALEAFDVFDPRSRFRPAPAAPSRRPNRPPGAGPRALGPERAAGGGLFRFLT